MARPISSSHRLVAAGLVAAAAFSVAPSLVLANSETVTAHPESAIGKSLQAPESKSFLSKVGDRLASLDIKLKVKLFEVELIDGLRAALNYRYAVEPSYDGEYHLRMDRATLTADANVGDLIGRANRYVGLSLKHETEFLYVRPFQKKTDALKAVPFGYEAVPTSIEDILSRLPFNSQNIIDHLGVGEMFSFTAMMNLVVGANTLPLSVSTPAIVWTHYMVSGEFQVHVIKADAQKVRVKLIAVQKTEKGVGFTAGIGKGHEIFGLRVVDRQIERVTNLTEMIKMGTYRMTSALFLVDYMLNFKDPRVRDAYDGLMSKVLQFNTLKIAKPWTSKQELTNKLISDVTPFEALYLSESSKPAHLRVVDRFFKGNNKVENSDRTPFKFAPVIMKLARETEYYENMLTSERADGALDYYRLHTFQRTLESSFWFSYYKQVGVSRASLLFDSDGSQKIGNLRDIVFEWNYRDKSLTESEIRMIKDAVKQAVPESIHGKINWGSFTQNKEYANARFIYKVLLQPEALNAVKSRTSGEIFGLLSDYIQSIPEPSASKDEAPDGMGFNSFYTVADKYRDQLLTIAHYMAKVVDPKLTNDERSAAFSELRFSNLFIEIGPGFLISLLPPTNLPKYVNFEITMTADDVPPMTYHYGVISDRKVYEAASYIHSVLKADEFESITQLMKTTATK